MKTAAAYIRVSTDEQIEFSPDSQLKAIRQYAGAHDMYLSETFIFVDEGISGRKAEKRPAFQRMIGTAKCKPKPFDVILLWKFSRFARNREDSIVYKSMLRKQCGIDVISISEQLSEDKTSILIEALIEAMDEYYSLNLAEEVRRGMNEKFSRGGVVSHPPLGYRMQDGVFVPDETNAGIVQMIFADYLAGMGVRQIACKLNAMGIRTAQGNPFENRTVEYILTNPVYIGKLRRSQNGRDVRDRFHENPENTMLADGSHTPLISPEIFQAAQEKRQRVKQLYRRCARQEPVSYMLKGLVRCDACGATLVMTASGKYLQCHNYSRGACRVSHGISLAALNQLLTAQLCSDLEDADISLQIARPAPQSTQNTAAIHALIAKEQKKLLRIRDAYENGVDTLAEYRENKAVIQLRIAALEQQLADSVPQQPADVRPFTGQIHTGLQSLMCPAVSETVKNIALRSIIDTILFVKPAGRLEIIYK